MKRRCANGASGGYPACSPPLRPASNIAKAGLVSGTVDVVVVVVYRISIEQQTLSLSFLKEVGLLGSVLLGSWTKEEHCEIIASEFLSHLGLAQDEVEVTKKSPHKVGAHKDEQTNPGNEESRVNEEVEKKRGGMDQRGRSSRSTLGVVAVRVG